MYCKMAGLGSNGQSTLSSPASSRRLPMLRAETVNLSGNGAGNGANGRGGLVGIAVNDVTYASGSLSSDGGGDPNAPARADFMISFLVDARGGTMHGCRFSGVKVYVMLAAHISE
jgi:hypothetical protein